MPSPHARLACAATLVALACTTAPTAPPPRVRLPFERARSAVDSLNTALFDLQQAGETVTLSFFVDSAGGIFLTITQP